MEFSFYEEGFRPHKVDRAGLWLIAVGTGLLLLGLAACVDLAVTTVAATYGIGGIMVLASAFQLAHAVSVQEWRETIFWLASALLYFLAGALVISEPKFAASLLTLILAASLATSGVARLALGVVKVRRGSGWLIASGLFSLAAATAIALTWPLDTVWLLGFVLAVDLLFQGFAMILIGFTMPRLP